MTEETENLVLEILKRLQADVATLKSDVATLKTDGAVVKADVAMLKAEMTRLRPLPERMDRMEAQMGKLIRVVDGLADSVSLRFDQHEARLERLERRWT